jgi:hypothetical protein
LLAAGDFAAQRLLLTHAFLGVAGQGWRVALKCVEIGLLGLGLALGLGATAGAALAGWWQPQPPHSTLAWAWVVAAGGLTLALRGLASVPWRETGVWAAFAGAMGLALLLPERGMDSAACLFVLGVALVLAYSSWRLATCTASDLARADQRVP